MGRTLRPRIALSAALRRLATWADPYPGFYTAARSAPGALVTYDANGKRVLISVPADRVQCKIGEVRGCTWTADDIHKTFAGRNWKSRLCAEIDAAITMAMERRGATW